MLTLASQLPLIIDNHNNVNPLSHAGIIQTVNFEKGIHHRLGSSAEFVENWVKVDGESVVFMGDKSPEC